jgi:hypothetical protein
LKDGEDVMANAAELKQRLRRPVLAERSLRTIVGWVFGLRNPRSEIVGMLTGCTLPYSAFGPDFPTFDPFSRVTAYSHAPQYGFSKSHL